jgi:V8-like Glu-specific endopeptidase
MKHLIFFKVILGFAVTVHTSSIYSQNCDLTSTENRRTEVLNMIEPYSFIVQMTMKRGKSYYGTAFLIHPRILLTAGHNLRKKHSIFSTRVKSLRLRFGATNQMTNLYERLIGTTQFENIYTHPDFNTEYTIGKDYGIIILPDDSAYQKIGGYFRVTIFDSLKLSDKMIHIGGYPGDKPFCTQWRDSTINYFFYKNYMHYDFATEHGASGAPIWYSEDNYNKVFAIHTNGDGFDKYKCNTGTLITKEIYNDIVHFCLSKGIDITK